MIEFDELMKGDGTWVEALCNSDDWNCYEKFKPYCNNEYDYYLCWAKGCKDDGTLYKVKKKKVCSKCGRKLDDN